ncbi:hypothetical protein ABT364_04730 [Massilia sp. SR12]
MEQQEKQQRILGHAVGREITAEELAHVTGAAGGQIGTMPFGDPRNPDYLDLIDDPTL